VFRHVIPSQQGAWVRTKGNYLARADETDDAFDLALAEALLSADARLPTGSVAGGQSLLRHPANCANVARVSGACRRL
jgi:hypothetical protein